MHVSRRKKCVLCAQVEQWQMENRRLKTPTSAYVDFVDDYLLKKITDYASLREAVSAGITALLQQ